MATRLGPVPLPVPIEDRVEEHRHLFCTRYDVCLGRAAHDDWASWTCRHCVRFQRLRRARADARRVLGSREDGGAVAVPARAELTGAISGAGTCSPTPPAPPSRDRAQQVSHTLEEASGLLQMRLAAPSVPALFVEAARAVAEVIRGRPETSAEWAEEVSIAAPGFERLLVAWIGELVRRSVESHVRFEEFDIVYVSDRQLVASIRGVRVVRMRAPSRTAAYRDPCLVRRPGHVTAMPVLEV